jgi:RNA polymerase primary sigma factor
LAIDDKFEDDITNLIETGKEKGYLTYGDVNDMIPDDLGTADDMDDLLTTIGSQGIDLREGPSSPATRISRLKRARMLNST